MLFSLLLFSVAVKRSSLGAASAASVWTAGVPRARIVTFPHALPAKGFSKAERSAANEATVRRALDTLPAKAGFELSGRFKTVVSGFAATMDDDDAAHFAALGATIEDDRVVTAATMDVVRAPAGRAASNDRSVGVNSHISWGLDRIDQPLLPLDHAVPAPTQLGWGVDVFVLDEGVRTDHDEFVGRVGDGFDAFGGTGAGYEDSCDHGTHCAGIALGSTYGVATAAILHSVRVLRCDTGGTTKSVLEGLEWVADHPADKKVVSISLGGGYSVIKNRAVNELVDLGVVVVVAAGNDADDACYYSPASASKAITVGASNELDGWADFSNHGACVDIFAPGTNIVSASVATPSATAVHEGTSMAAPFVSGVAAQIMSNLIRAQDVWPSVRSLAVGGVLMPTSASVAGPDLLLQAACSIWPHVIDMSILFACGDGSFSGQLEDGFAPHGFALFGTGASVTFDTCGSSFDTGLKLYAQCNELVSDDDGGNAFAGCGALDSHITYTLAAGVLYHVEVYNVDGADVDGNYFLNVHNRDGCQPTGCADTPVASELSCAGASRVEGSTVGAPDIYGVGQGEVWHKVVGTGAPNVLHTCGSAIDTVLHVVKGCPSAGGTFMFGNDDQDPDGSRCASATASRTPVMPLPAGETFYVMVEGVLNEGAYALTQSGCNNLAGCPLEISSALACSSGRVFTWTGTTGALGYAILRLKGTGGEVTVDTCGSEFDTMLTLFSDCFSLGSPVSSNDDAPAGACGEGDATSSQLRATVPAGEERLLAVSPFDNTPGGVFKMRIQCPVSVAATAIGSRGGVGGASVRASAARGATTDVVSLGGGAIGGIVAGGCGLLSLIAGAIALVIRWRCARVAAKIDAEAATQNMEGGGAQPPTLAATTEMVAVAASTTRE